MADNNRQLRSAPSEPRALKDPATISNRTAMLDMPHIAPLRDFARALRTEGQGMVPDFDPLDGGTEAEILFLMEKPGPMTDNSKCNTRGGSGFVSRDNADPTAEAMFRFMAEAGINRRQSTIWNTVPWWNGTRSIKQEELALGIDRLADLLDILPNLRAVVGVGKKAERAKGIIAERGLPFITSAHPSPINRARRPEVWACIPQQWAIAKRYLTNRIGE